MWGIPTITQLGMLSQKYTLLRWNPAHGMTEHLQILKTSFPSLTNINNKHNYIIECHPFTAN